MLTDDKNNWLNKELSQGHYLEMLKKKILICSRDVCTKANVEGRLAGSDG